MEQREYFEILREKYQNIMAKFVYQGKEPEGKERLRHLFCNQIAFVSSLAPEPGDLVLLNEIYEAPPAGLILWMPNPDDKKQEWFTHGIKWVDNYVDELWDMGIGQ